MSELTEEKAREIVAHRGSYCDTPNPLSHHQEYSMAKGYLLRVEQEKQKIRDLQAQHDQAMANWSDERSRNRENEEIMKRQKEQLSERVAEISALRSDLNRTVQDASILLGEKTKLQHLWNDKYKENAALKSKLGEAEKMAEKLSVCVSVEFANETAKEFLSSLRTPSDGEGKS